MKDIIILVVCTLSIIVLTPIEVHMMVLPEKSEYEIHETKPLYGQELFVKNMDGSIVEYGDEIDPWWKR